MLTRLQAKFNFDDLKIFMKFISTKQTFNKNQDITLSLIVLKIEYNWVQQDIKNV